MAEHTANSGLLLSNRAYNILQQIALLGLPGLGAFYFGMSTLWNWAYGEQVVGSCTLAGVFIGVILKMSQAAYNNSNNPDGKYDGDLMVGITDPDRPNTVLVAGNKSVDELALQKQVVLKVQPVRVAGTGELNEEEIPSQP